MNKVRVVTAFVPLNVKHMTTSDYMTLGEKMTSAAKRAGAEVSWFQQTLNQCWAYDLCTGRRPATETPDDRYASPIEHVASHIVQHNRTEWAMNAVSGTQDDVVIWLDLGILKQGKWNGNPITEDDVSWFVEAVQMYPFNDIPFPGIDPNPANWFPRGNNWRFCGSTHAWPRKWLPAIDHSYKFHLRSFVMNHGCVPLDLAIWPLVERHSGLPFRWYKAEYDASQLRNWPCAL